MNSITLMGGPEPITANISVVRYRLGTDIFQPSICTIIGPDGQLTYHGNSTLCTLTARLLDSLGGMEPDPYAHQKFDSALRRHALACTCNCHQAYPTCETCLDAALTQTETED